MMKVYSTKISVLENVRSGLKCDIANAKKDFLRLPNDVPQAKKVAYKDYIHFLESKLQEILNQISVVKYADEKSLEQFEVMA